MGNETTGGGARTGEAPREEIVSRLRRLEESVAFVEHSIDELRKELLELDKGLREVAARLTRIEALLGEMGAREEE